MDYHNHPPPPQSVALLCPRHQDYVKGICLFDGHCSERLLCRVCRKFHDNNHLNNYEELEDLFNGKLLNDILTDFDQLVKKLDHQMMSYHKENQHTIVQLDNMFTQMQEYIVRKFNETRNGLVSEINKRLQARSDLKTTIMLQIHEIKNHYQAASKANFQSHHLIDEFLDTIVKSQNVKNEVMKNPNFGPPTTTGLNTALLTSPALDNLLQHVKTFQDKICADIFRNFTSPPPQAPPVNRPGFTPGRSGDASSTFKDRAGSSLFGGLPPHNLFKDVTPFKLGERDRGERGERGTGLPRHFGFQPGATFPPAAPENRDAGEGPRGMEVETEAEGSGPKKWHHSPLRLLQMFGLANQEKESERKRPSRRGQSAGSTGKVSGPETRRPQSEDPGKREKYSVKFKTSLGMEHKQSSFGGMVYVKGKEQIVVSGNDGYLEMWDIETKQRKKTVNAHNGEIMKMKYLEEKGMLLTAGIDGKICVWNYKKDFEYKQTFEKHKSPVLALEYLPDLDLVISGGDDEHLRIWKPETGDQLQVLKTRGTKIGALCYLRKLGRVAVGFDKGHINIIEISHKTKKVNYTIKAHTGYVINLASVDDKKMLISTGSDGFIKIWEVRESQHSLLRKIYQKAEIRGLAVFGDKDLIVGVNENKELKIWKMSTGEMVYQHKDKAFGEAIIALPGRNEIATTADKQLKLWTIL